MERRIIYYPTIVIPSQWTKWTVLYFDKVISIIPENLNFKEVIYPWNEKDFRIMKILMDEGELERANPQDLIGQREKWRSVEMFEKEFRRIVTSKRFQSIINRNWKRNHKWKVHRDKISYKVYEFLHNQGLAEEDKQRDWILMEEKTSLLYMSLLAKYLADVNPDFTIPGTDRNEYENMIYGASSHQNSFVSLDIKFMNILPIPRWDVPINDILRFKRRRKDELLHFREIIDNIYREISIAENEREIKQTVLSYKENIERKVAELRKTMKEENIKTVLGAFKSLLDIKSPALLTTLGVSFAELPSEIKIPVLGMTAIIQIGYYLVDKINQQRAKLRTSPFAYLYYAEKAKVI